MAFNDNCLGCVGWFEFGRLVAMPESKEPVSGALTPYIRFFNTRRDLFTGAQVVADAAVWRSFASQVYAAPEHSARTADVEERLIQERVPFQIIYDGQLRDLKRYRAVVLAGCVAVSDTQLANLKAYAAQGGRLVIVGDFATADEWMNPRPIDRLVNLPAERLTRIGLRDDCLQAIREACPGGLAVRVDAEAGLCMELAAQENRRLVHLVNYRDQPARNVGVRLRLPAGTSIKSVKLTSPEQPEQRELSVTQKDDTANFTVASVGTYEIAVVELDRRVAIGSDADEVR
jgi:hypothetical protein